MYFNYVIVQRNAESKHIVAVGEGDSTQALAFTHAHTPAQYQGII